MTAAAENPGQALQDEVLADARRQADQIVRSARAEADEILRKAQAEADGERRSRLASAEAEAARLRQRAMAAVPIQVARRRAECAEAALRAIYDEAVRMLAAREGFDYRRALTRLAAQAVAGMEGTRFILEVSDADRAALGEDWLLEVARMTGREGLELAYGPAAPAVGGGGAAEPSFGRSGAEDAGSAGTGGGASAGGQVAEDAGGAGAASGGASGRRISGGVVVRSAEGRCVWDNTFSSRLERLWPMLRHQVAEAVGLIPGAGRPGPAESAAKEAP